MINNSKSQISLNTLFITFLRPYKKKCVVFSISCTTLKSLSKIKEIN